MYIIDNKVHFCPDKAKFRPVNTDLFSKKLPTPSSKILKGLIQSNGDILPYEELYKIGWGEKHIYIKPNTLYQHISTLRRAFEDCGMEGKWIVTHQRKGVSLNIPSLLEIDPKMDCYSTQNIRNHSPPEKVSLSKTAKKHNALDLVFISIVLTPAVLLTEILGVMKVRHL